MFCTSYPGLCGDFNSVRTDDFRTINGLVEGTAVTFANTWKNKASCPDVAQNFEMPCSLSVENGTPSTSLKALTYVKCSSSQTRGHYPM